MSDTARGAERALEMGRNAFAHGAWTSAYEQLSAADASAPLGAADLERLAIAASLIGRDANTPEIWTRAHTAWLPDDRPRAARCTFWLALDLIARGEDARASGWVARTRRLLRDAGVDCAEDGLLLALEARLHIRRGDAAAAISAAQEAEAASRRFDDDELRAFTQLIRAQVLARRGMTSDAVVLFDELMVAVTVGAVSPIGAGILYCAVIEGCHAIFDVARAREWTDALSAWCDAQPDLMLFRGQCIVHRAEIMRLSGAWSQALAETSDACNWLLELARQSHDAAVPGGMPAFKYPIGALFYQLAEIHRVRGEYADAEHHYREASRYGRAIEPGHALLRHSQGRLDDAAAAIRTALHQPQPAARRAEVLAAAVEILLDAHDEPGARDSADQLSAMAADADAPYLHALSSRATGHTLLAGGDARAALTALRESWTLWQQLAAPYEAARVRVLIALADRALDDFDSAELELDAARTAFATLGARPDADRATTLARAAQPAESPLTRRELQVIALLATGRTNRAIAEDLSISERTVDRHVSNILMKLDLPSRAAATAYAYRNNLV